MSDTKIEIVGIYDSEFRQLVSGSVPMSAIIQEGSKIFTHPLETGVSVSDHKIILPIEITIDMMLPRGLYLDLYATIRQIFHGNDTFIIQTRTMAYKNMALAQMPHEEHADQFDVIPISLTFQEAIFVETQFQALPPAKVRNKRDASTVKRGEQQGGKKSSLAFKGASKIGIVKKESV